MILSILIIIFLAVLVLALVITLLEQRKITKHYETEIQKQLHRLKQLTK